jgi:hypothetical protein
MGLEVEAMDVGMGRGDSRMETAACAGRVGEAAEDLASGGLERCQELRRGCCASERERSEAVGRSRHILLPVMVTRFFSKSMSYRSMPMHRKSARFQSRKP